MELNRASHNKAHIGLQLAHSAMSTRVLTALTLSRLHSQVNECRVSSHGSLSFMKRVCVGEYASEPK